MSKAAGDEDFGINCELTLQNIPFPVADVTGSVWVRFKDHIKRLPGGPSLSLSMASQFAAPSPDYLASLGLSFLLCTHRKDEIKTFPLSVSSFAPALFLRQASTTL